MKRDLLLAGAVIVLAALGIGVVVVLPWLQEDDKPKTVPPKTAPIVQMPKKEEPKPAAKKEPIVLAVLKEKKNEPTPKKIDVKAEPKIEPPPKKIEEKKVPPKVEVKIEPKVEPKVEGKKPPADKIIAIGDDFIKLNDPDGEYTMKTMNRGLKTRLIGTIKTLRIAGANEGSVLDASGLTADEIVFTGDVNSGSTVVLGKAGTIKLRSVNNRSTIDASTSSAREIVLTGAVNSGSTVKLLAAAKGSVEILGEVNDRSEIVIDAEGGKVLFKSRGDAAINGNTKVQVLAREVEFAGAINGPQTEIQVTLTKDGALKFHRLSRGVRLSYRKANESDPELRLEKGQLDANAQFQRLPAVKK